MRVLCGIALLTGLLPAAERPVDLVNPFVDTHKSRWFFFASAGRPFGMVKLSPDTQMYGTWNSGYLYNEKYVRAFSHIHDWQIAGVPVMPATGGLRGHQGFEAAKSAFSHDKEIARPGYHKVFLDDYGITAELTSTKRVGFHRYHFPASEQAHIYFDVGARIAHGPISDAWLRRVSDRELEGWAVMAPTNRRKKQLKVFFAIQLNRPFSRFTVWRPLPGEAAKEKPVREVVPGNPEEVAGAETGGAVSFKFARPETVLLKVAISYVGQEQARLNMAAELPHWDFDRVVRESEDEWNEILGRMEVTGGTREQRVKFYTDLWHALLGRGAFSDANGKYVDNTGDTPKVRQVPLDGSGKPVRDTYNSDSFWGSHWTLNVLWPIAWPKVMNDQAASLVDYYSMGGMIARGPSGGNYTFVMIGDQALPLIAAAYFKGIHDFDLKAAYDGSRKNAFPGGIRDHAGYEAGPNAEGGGMKYYVERGYVPLGQFGTGSHREGAAQTLEYAYQDAALANLARALGHVEDARLFGERSRNWRKLFDPSTGYIRPRNMDGSWYEPFTPTCEGFNCRGFVESNAAIYTYFVPHDLPGLIDALGGNEKFVEKLQRQFELAAPARFITPHGKHGENWIDYENQPACHMAHLFSHAGAPWLTQYWVRRVKRDVFGNITPQGGYNGDEDQGQMGALGVLMAIGLFDSTGGIAPEPRYEITTPLFDRVTIRLDAHGTKGRRFVIRTVNNSASNDYIQSARLNGRPLEGRFWITHAELLAGGELELTLGPQPYKRWGVANRRAN